MNGCALRDLRRLLCLAIAQDERSRLPSLDVAQNIQARTGWSGGGYQSEHATQERDPSPGFGRKEKTRRPP